MIILDLIAIIISVFVRNTSRTYKPSVDSIVLAKNRIISGVPSVGTTQLDCGEPRSSFFATRGCGSAIQGSLNSLDPNNRLSAESLTRSGW